MEEDKKEVLTMYLLLDEERRTIAQPRPQVLYMRADREKVKDPRF
jgi:hypothetical protein